MEDLDCLHLQLYRDSKDRYKQGQTKASLSLQHFLGVETGFTLDKESNTIAILCQDVTVVLAFDTRERLIQWQVKIANNLGEDQQFLVQISSAPPKAKIASGPARLHVQEYRFCVTLGVPPRLVGIWEISKLRRYGVVESRFCFEGGSRCGKGEGLYVLMTDQGEDITKTLQAASEGKMTARRRPASRNMSVMDSPRKSSTRMSSMGGDTMSLCQRSMVDSVDCQSLCRSVMNPDDGVWPSSETTGPVSDFGDTASVGDFHDSHSQECGNWSVERCASCISKLGAMSRSSTAGHTPGNGFSPAWVMETSITSLNGDRGRERANTNPVSSAMSVCSHDSGSDYSVPRLQAANDSWSCRGASPCECDGPPLRPPKPEQVKQNAASNTSSNNTANTPNRKKPPMPLPHHNYGNYDVPKSIFPVPHDDKKPTIARCSNGGVETVAGEYYDTPKALKECLAYSNYDRPPSIHPRIVGSGMPMPVPTMVTGTGPGWCLAGAHQTRVVLEEDRGSCPCRRLVCWPSNWISLPYCRRGNSVENTSVHLQKVKLNGEGKMPIINNCGELAIYATIDKTKKTKYKQEDADGKEDKENEPEAETAESDVPNCNYVNVEFPNDKEPKPEIQANYENLDFAQSLEYYENSKDVLQRAGLNKENVPCFTVDRNGVKFCTKCGHACGAEMQANEKTTDDYLMMEPQNAQKPSSKFPGYLPMHPSTKTDSSKNLDVKTRLARGLHDRAASIPSLVDKSRRSDSDMRVPGSAMLGMNHPQSANSSPYLMRRNPIAVSRKRSSSADSTRYEDDEVTLRCSQETVESLSRPEEEVDPPNGSVQSVIEANDSLRSIVESVSPDSTTAVPVRRSSSVPCKPANRDSSSSNDSGVSTGSLKHRGGDFAEFELPLTTSMSSRRHLLTQALHASQDCCLHASLPRRSKSSDPLRELSFQFPRVKVPAKSSSAEAEIPICHNKREPKEYTSPNGDGAIVVPYIDSRSTSSGTSDMSDYIETLSMSSHSSSDTPDSLRLGRIPVTTLRPRSGKEYHKIDRYILEDVKAKGLNTIITTVPEKSESPSPGYMSSSSTN
ncbi:Docking protein 7 [Nesidiocoris tenuis]|uniref:Docking protein 7 n=1 Tax=Nesidiocoris tenuis TaxID=355587 RepID=A0ABN7AJ32_9HEMI|nr:Docking protein 7 [Nesidiocoris tenuis]